MLLLIMLLLSVVLLAQLAASTPKLPTPDPNAHVMFRVVEATQKDGSVELLPFTSPDFRMDIIQNESHVLEKGEVLRCTVRTQNNVVLWLCNDGLQLVPRSTIFKVNGQQ